MMSTPYIAGPWGHDRRIIFADGAAIAEVFSGACRNLAEADATERLIAAAPDLFEAARAAEALLTRQRFRADEFSPEGVLLQALRKAIAKVEGGTK